jgi:hypothetical protein
VNVEIQFDWEEVGKITSDGASDIHVPKAFREPAVYKIQSKVGIYVGETKDLKRRLGNYCKPGGSELTKKPRTNRRVKRKILNALPHGEVSVLKAVNLKYSINGGQSLPIDLDKKHERLFAENAIITALGLQGGLSWNDPDQT